MKKTLKFFITTIFSILLFSCNHNGGQVRFVNLSGNPGQLHLTTPSENLTALSRQGRASESALSREKRYQSQKSTQKQFAVNKYSNNNNQKIITPNPATKNPKQNPELLYTMDMPVNKKNNNNNLKREIQSKDIYITEQKNTSPNNFNKSPRVLSEIKIPSKKPDSNFKVSGGLYVQVGSFRNKNVAKSHLEKVKKITNNPSNVKIQKAKVKNKNYYRVLIGPISKRVTAKIISKNLKEKGQNSILIKVK